MALANLLPFILDGPWFVFIDDTTNFNTNPNVKIPVTLDGKYLKPDPATFTNAVLAAYTNGKVTFSRKVNITSKNFNEIASEPAIQRYKSEAITVTFSNETVLFKTTLDQTQGIYSTRYTTGALTVDTFYGGNTTIAPTKGAILVATKQDGNPTCVCIPSISMSSDLVAALERGDTAASQMVFTALPTSTRETWWIQPVYTTTALA